MKIKLLDMYSKQKIWLAVILLIVSAAGTMLIHPDSYADLKNGEISCTRICESCVLPNGNLLINDSYKKIYLVNAEGDYLKALQRDNYEFSAIHSDENGNIYISATQYENSTGSVIADSIYQYDSDLNFIKELDKRKTGDNGENDIGIYTSEYYIEGNKLYYSRMWENEIKFYEVNVESGEVKEQYCLHSDTPYLYRGTVPISQDTYAYSKSTGEIGIGNFNGSQTIYYTFIGDKDAKGEAPLVPTALGKTLYVIDNNAGTLWTVKKGSRTRFFSDNDDMGKKTVLSAFGCMSGRLSGVFSENAVWYMDTDGSIHSINKIRLTGRALQQEWVKAFNAAISKVILAGCAVYFLSFLVYLFFRKQSKLFFKFFCVIPIVVIMSIVLFRMIYQTYNDKLIQDKIDSLAKINSLAATQFNVEEIKQFQDSTFFETDAYRDIQNKMMKTFSAYGSYDSEMVSRIFVVGKNNVYVIASNYGYSMCMFQSKLAQEYDFEAYIAENMDDRGVAVLNDGEYIDFYIPIYDTDGQTIVAYLNSYLPIENTDNLYQETLYSTLPVLVTGLAVLLVIILTISISISITASRAEKTIMEIAGGNLSARVNRISNDEVGNISTCVNSMAEGLQKAFAENERLSRESRLAQMEVIASFSEIVESKSGQTGEHVKRVAEYTEILALSCGMSAQETEYLKVASMMHDIGKLLIPSEILEKPGKLTDEEYEAMKKHSVYGEELLHNAPGIIMSYAKEVALNHHERWDGRGYPNGRSGEEIPLLGRIVAIADTFDAITSKRSYKSALSAEEAFEIIIKESGKQFDPQLVELFQKDFPQFEKVCKTV